MQLAFKIQGTESFPTAHLLAINQGGKTTAQLRGKKKDAVIIVRKKQLEKHPMFCCTKEKEKEK